MNRRSFLMGVSWAGLLVAGDRALAARVLPDVFAFRYSGCECCGSWARSLEIAGFKVALRDEPDLASRRKLLGIPESFGRCHFAQIGRYIIEGHVPVDDILRILEEQPDAMGLATLGMMPLGSPGMETEGMPEQYSVLIFKADGTSQVFSKH